MCDSKWPNEPGTRRGKLAGQEVSGLWSKLGSLVTVSAACHSGISCYIVNLITRKHCEGFIRRLFAVHHLTLYFMCSAFQVPIFYRIWIYKRPWHHANWFFEFHLSLGETLQFVQFVIQEDIPEVYTLENLTVLSTVMYTWLENQKNIMSLTWHARHFVWVTGNISVSLNWFCFRCLSALWWMHWFHSNVLFDMLFRGHVFHPVLRHILDAQRTQAWVLC